MKQEELLAYIDRQEDAKFRVSVIVPCFISCIFLAHLPLSNMFYTCSPRRSFASKTMTPRVWSLSDML